MICLDSLLLIAPLFGLENCCKSIFDGETREKSFPEALVHNYSSCFSGVLQKRRPIAYLSTWNNLQWVKLPEKTECVAFQFRCRANSFCIRMLICLFQKEAKESLCGNVLIFQSHIVMPFGVRRSIQYIRVSY